MFPCVLVFSPIYLLHDELLLSPRPTRDRTVQILPARAVPTVQLQRGGFAGLQSSARGTGAGNGNSDAEKHPAVQAHWFRLFSEHDLLWGSRNPIHRVRHFTTQVAGITGSGLSGDRIGITVGSRCELFGEQKVSVILFSNDSDHPMKRL